MVTTRITEATPITMPRPVRTERTGLARSACTLNFSDSPSSMSSGSRLLEKLAGFGARRIVGGKVGSEIALQQLARQIQIPATPDVGVGTGEHDFRTVGLDLLGRLKGLVTFLEAALAGEKLGEIQQAP